MGIYIYDWRIRSQKWGIPILQVKLGSTNFLLEGLVIKSISYKERTDQKYM